MTSIQLRASTIAAYLSLSLAAPLSAQPSEATERLRERNKMFAPSVIKVAENVYTAIGYQVSATP